MARIFQRLGDDVDPRLLVVVQPNPVHESRRVCVGDLA
jgi:hypothetical protein